MDVIHTLPFLDAALALDVDQFGRPCVTDEDAAAIRAGIPAWHPRNDRDGTGNPPAGDPPAGDPPAGDPPAGDPPAGDPPGDELGEGGKAALVAERKARQEAERRAATAEKEAKTLKDAQLSKEEKLQQDADEGKKLAATATDKLRRANLLGALAEEGLSGAKGKAAARLLEGVEFDDQDEPKNLDAALTAAKAEYGDEMFTAASGAPGGGGREKPSGKGKDGGATPPGPGANGDEHPAGMARIRAGYAAQSRSSQ